MEDNSQQPIPPSPISQPVTQQPVNQQPPVNKAPSKNYLRMGERVGLLAIIFTAITFLFPFVPLGELKYCFSALELGGLVVLFTQLIIMISILLGAIGLFSKKYLLLALAFGLLFSAHSMNPVISSSACDQHKDLFYYLYYLSGYLSSILFLISALFFSLNKKQIEPNIEKSNYENRPLIITIMCLLFGGILGGSLFMSASFLIMGMSGINIGTLMYLIPEIIILATIFGYWKMRKWSVYLFSAIFIYSVSCIAFVIFTHEASISEIPSIGFLVLFIWLIVICISFYSFKKIEWQPVQNGTRKPILLILVFLIIAFGGTAYYLTAEQNKQIAEKKIDMQNQLRKGNVYLGAMLFNHSISELTEIEKKNIGLSEGLKYGALILDESILTKLDLVRFNVSSGDINIVKNSFPRGIIDNSPADLAGLKGGDVILEINNEKVLGSSDLFVILEKYKPNDKITLKIIRDNVEREVSVELKKSP